MLGTFFSDTVPSGEIFVVNPLQGEDTLGTKIFINDVELHTSCSDDIYIGMAIAVGTNHLVITYGESLRGGRLCTGASRKRDPGHGPDDDDEEPSQPS